MTSRPITHVMPQDTKAIACLGDSITEGYFDETGLGWVGHFSKLLAQKNPLGYHVRNFGISGDTVIDAWDEDKKYGQTSFRYEQSAIKDYNDTLEELCGNNSIPFIRLFENWKDEDMPSLFTDGLHPNAKGHNLLAQQIFEQFEKIGF